MVRPITKLLIVSWMALVPALCMGGAIVHPCDPAAGACRNPASRTDCPQEPAGGCGHENSCSNDPCAGFKAVKASGGSDADMALSIAWLAIEDAASATLTKMETFQAFGCEPPPDAKLPFPPSDLPLLI